MAAFPSFGLFLFDGYGEQPATGLVRTNMESGPPKQARIRSRVMVTRPVQYRYSFTDYQSFKTFIKTTLSGGVDWFSWPDPLDGQLKPGRIVNGVYQARAVSIGESNEPDWIVNFDLETWE